MYRAFAVTPSASYAVTGGSGGDVDTLAKAKSVIQNFLTTNKASFQNGYDVYIIDTESHQVVSRATIPQPSLTWLDSAPRS